MIIIEVSTKKCTKPLREVEVDYEIDNSKCEICKDKPCLEACPVEAIYIDSENDLTKINEKCFGCVLCRKACPYDAINIETKLADPIRENIPNINSKLCRACGACVSSCKTGAIHLTSSGSEEVHSEIDEDKCVRCGYCFRSCPTDAIKYGEILPRTVSGGRAIVVNQKDCIGCMTCTRICPSRGAINIGKTSKLPYIDPSYCARCEECMEVCPSSAIKYSSRKKAYESFNKIRSLEIASSIIDKDIKKLSNDISKIDSLLANLVGVLSSNTENQFEINVTDRITKELDNTTSSDIVVVEMKDLVEYFPPIRKIKVFEYSCIGCGECISVCPVNAIWLEAPSPIHIDEKCVFCGKCVPRCPVTAIELIEDFFEIRDDDIYFIRRNITDVRDGEFEIHKNLCQACGVCVNQCPVDALTLKNDEIYVNQDLCISCRECEALCPVNAIKIDLNNE
ncbi:4Fe-4S binding protein [Methanobrevibacter sp. TMH8]|uniref:4Fe-4S binding protein n=1 Tax=Methanobrevibacter sp. TMH8 TaxID=2848611 RepID=UPI001CC8EDC8|nr:4Fe-4S binding protein [Methanobrevibacter sp. TMH8]MBZ9571338.1 4Fe-4S binding protein [Methanobrevibacter sp. TMH8]